MRRSPGLGPLVLAFASSALLAAGCVDREGEDAAVAGGAVSADRGGPPAAGTESEEPAATDLTAPASAWTIGIACVTRPLSGVATVTDVRTASHPGFDRIVWEFAPGERPGYHVEYIDRPVRECGSGNVVPLAGDGWLEVRLEPARAHDEAGKPTLREASGARDRRLDPGLPVVRELARTCDFEAVVAYVMGVTSPNPFRVAELETPPRLVVDIRR
ncbi:MAG TPA: hypothetical protein VM737_11470 [Gemmatimonadota bacterium]|nr:hypothetical protein [Gemmatimonadota bacterium]